MSYWSIGINLLSLQTDGSSSENNHFTCFETRLAPAQPKLSTCFDLFFEICWNLNSWGESVANGEAKHSISNLVEGDMGLPMVGMQSSFQVGNPSILEVPWGTPWSWTHSHCSWLLVKNQTSHSSLGSEFQPLTDPQVIQRMRLNFPWDPKSPSQSNRFFWSPTMLPCCPMAEYLQYEFCITLRHEMVISMGSPLRIWGSVLNGVSTWNCRLIPRPVDWPAASRHFLPRASPQGEQRSKS